MPAHRIFSASGVPRRSGSSPPPSNSRKIQKKTRYNQKTPNNRFPEETWITPTPSCTVQRHHGVNQSSGLLENMKGFPPELRVTLVFSATGWRDNAFFSASSVGFIKVVSEFLAASSLFFWVITPSWVSLVLCLKTNHLLKGALSVKTNKSQQIRSPSFTKNKERYFSNS